MSCCGVNNELPPRLDEPAYEPQSLRRGRSTTSPPPSGQVVKLVVLGDASVGKTSLLKRFCDDEFGHAYKATIGADFVSKRVETKDPDRSFTLQIWDTAGQERFHSIGSVFYRGSHGCGLVLDVTKRESLHNLAVWKARFEASVPPDELSLVPFLVMANKTDVDPARWQVTREEIQQFCQDRLAPANAAPLSICFTSAKTGENVNESFEKLLQAILLLNDDLL